MQRIKMFGHGLIDSYFDDFATFIFNRKAEQQEEIITHIKKIASGHDFKSPLLLLTERIDKKLIDISSPVKSMILKEMKSEIEKHAKLF